VCGAGVGHFALITCSTFFECVPFFSLSRSGPNNNKPLRHFVYDNCAGPYGKYLVAAIVKQSLSRSVSHCCANAVKTFIDVT
jgi:hypothetical protein